MAEPSIWSVLRNGLGGIKGWRPTWRKAKPRRSLPAASTNASGRELPGGGRVLFPGRRMIALYGTPSTPVLGVLGEQDLPSSIRRAKAIAAEYQALTDDVVVPAFEIIVTIASASATENGSYSRELPVESFVPWVEG